MTFKSIVALSIIAFFVLGSFALAGDSSENVSKTISGTSTSSASSAQHEPVSSEESVEESDVMEVFPVPVHTSFNRARSYTVQQIRRMPMVARPDRPGHFIGNTVRALYRSRRGW